MKKLKKQLQAGNTLIELILYLGIVAILSAGIYNFYNKKQIEIKASTLSQNLFLMDKGISQAYNTLGNFSTLTTTFLISANIPPKELIIDSSNIQNTLGGNLTFASATVGGNPAYGVTLTKLSSYACSEMATSKFGSYAQEVAINGTTVKIANGPLTPAQIINIAASCNNSDNTLIYRNTLLSAGIDAVGSTGLTRSKETAYNIATIGNPSTGAGASCSGGSTWNGSYCSCPTATEWSGSACVAFGTTTPQAGWCPRGQGWATGTKVCSALPNGSSSNMYLGGRNLPGSIITPVVQTTVGGTVAPTTTKTEVVAGRTINSTIGYVDNNTIQVCVNGSWDSTLLRCVTP